MLSRFLDPDATSCAKGCIPKWKHPNWSNSRLVKVDSADLSTQGKKGLKVRSHYRKTTRPDTRYAVGAKFVRGEMEAGGQIEAKVVVLGETNVGKTCMVFR